jgi:hypothetical protein
LALLLVLILASAATWLLRDSLFRLPQHNPHGLQVTNLPAATPERWTLDLANASVLDSKVTGRILGVRFNCEKVTLEGGLLSFFQNAGLPSERRVTIYLFSHRPERLADKTLEIPHDRTGPRPRVLLEVRHAREAPTTRTLDQNYALRMEFEEITESRLPGRIYLAFSDEEKSYITGRFEAQIIYRTRESPRQPTNAAPKL